MDKQCQSCGSFETITPCEYCPTLICSLCARSHCPLCAALQKRKKRGEGPTIANVPMPPHRSGQEIPEPVPPDRPKMLPMTAKRKAAVDAILAQPYHPELASLSDPTGFVTALTNVTGQDRHSIPGYIEAPTTDLEIMWSQEVHKTTADPAGIVWTNLGDASLMPPPLIEEQTEQVVCELMEMRPLPPRDGPTLQLFEYTPTKAAENEAINQQLDAVKDLLAE